MDTAEQNKQLPPLADRKTRKAAIEAMYAEIGGRPATAAVRAVIEAGVDRDTEPGSDCGFYLDEDDIGPVGADDIETLRQDLEHSEANTRNLVLYALRKIGPLPEALEVFTKALSHSETMTAENALSVLDDMGTARESARPALRKMAGRSSPFVEKAAIRLLNNLDEGKVSPLEKAMKDFPLRNSGLSDAAYETLRELGADAAVAVPELRKMLRHKTERHRYRSCQALGGIGPVAADAVPDLLRVMETDSSIFTRGMAAGALESVEAPAQEFVPVAVGCLSEIAQKKSGRSCAGFIIDSLASYCEEGREAFSVLLELLRTTRRDGNHMRVRESIIQALQALGPHAKEALPDLRKVLDNKYEHTQRVAARAMAHIASPPPEECESHIEAGIRLMLTSYDEHETHQLLEAVRLYGDRLNHLHPVLRELAATAEGVIERTASFVDPDWAEMTISWNRQIIAEIEDILGTTR